MDRRRFLQVSIRSLLILTTLVAIGCAYWTNVWQWVQQQKLVRARIASLGGKLQSRQTANAWPWLKTLVGDEYFQEVVAIDLGGTLVTNKDLALIGNFRRLESLSVEGLDPRTFSYAPLPRNNLKHLPSQITDEGIRQLGPQSRLLSAKLAFTPVTDDAMQNVASWSLLQELDLRATKITSNGVQRLEELQHLKKLYLDDTKVDDAAVASLCKLSSLRILSLNNTQLTGEGLLQLKEALPQCRLDAEVADFSSGIDPDANSMRWKEITRPLWWNSDNGDLKLLILSGTAATDKHLVDLDRLEKTDVIDLRRTQVSEAGIQTLQRALPNCKLLH